MSTATMPTWATAIFNHPPDRGDGLNRWLVKAAIAARRCGLPDSDIVDLLKTETAGQPIRHGEIERAVERSKQFMDTSGTHYKPASRWPQFDADARQRLIAECAYGDADLFDDSPWRFEDDTPATEAIIDALFPGNPLLCCGAKKTAAITMHREDWRGKLADQQLIVPSPMTATTGLSQEGKVSTRCLNNTGDRAFLIVEQDQGGIDEQAAIIRHLAAFAPLVLVTFSGGKSLHAWFRCRGASMERQRQFFNEAVRLGADPALWTRCQFARMPDGWRPDKAARQSVLYFAPEVTL